MKQNLGLFELGFKKVEEDKHFMAFYLKRYGEFENMNNETLSSMLNCSLSDFYKLSLCKIPESNSISFIEQLNVISNYTGIAILSINKVIKRVNSIITLSDNSTNTFLAAARDKKNKRD